MEFASSRNVEFVDIKFMDFIGSWQHFSLPIANVSEETFADGLGFDGSSIRGWKNIDESDMLVIPDPDTAFVDQFYRHPTLSVIGNIHDPITREPYERDPRYIARKAEQHLVDTGVAERACFGPEAEFFIFDDARYAQNEFSGLYVVDSGEGAWNTARQEDPNLAYKARFKGGYFPVPPTDSQQDIRSDMVKRLIECGLSPEVQHHEVATAGQSRCGARGPRERSRVSPQGGCLHRGRDPYLDRLQARERDRSDRKQTAPVRVLPLLRHLISVYHRSFVVAAIEQ